MNKIETEYLNLRKFIDNISETFKCPNCSKYFHKDIVQCVNGHSVCCECKEILKECPICNESFSEIPNVALENVIEATFLPCRYTEAGCDKKLIYPEWAEHIKVCPNKLYVCPMSQEWQCNWKGPLSAIRNHVFLDHFPLINIRTKVMIKLSKTSAHFRIKSPVSGIQKFYLVFLLLHNDKVFKAYEVHSITKNRIYEIKFIVECYGHKEEVENYVYTIEFVDRITNSICLASAKCVTAPWKFARHYFKTDFCRMPKDKVGLPEYEIRIMKKGEYIKGPRKRLRVNEIETDTSDEEKN